MFVGILNMDFSAFNPLSSNSLNIAARNNNVAAVTRLLKKHNPNCVDNRGWTCLHEAAANNSLDCLLLILRHPDCRPLAETYEGHTALYLACLKQSSTKIIKALLDMVDDIANYSSTEMVSPLHVEGAQGRTSAVQLLLQYGAMLDSEDSDGDTALHDAAFSLQHKVVIQLLYAGAQADKKNDALFTPLHLACFKGCLKSVKALYPFVSDINQCTANGETPLVLATQNGRLDILNFLLNHGADPHMETSDGDLPLKVALLHGNADIFKILLSVTDVDKINKNILLLACKPHYFNMDIIITLLESDLGPDFFNISEKFYITLEQFGEIQPAYSTNSPLNSFLHIIEYVYNQSPDLFRKLIYLFLMRGAKVNALHIDDCPPLVYLHYCEHTNCFQEVFNILLQHGCDVDYHSGNRIPDAFIASMATGGSTMPLMIQHSLSCEPMDLMHFICEINIQSRVIQGVQSMLMSLVDINGEGLSPENIFYFVPTLKHLCRVTIRKALKSRLRSDTLNPSRDNCYKFDSVPLPSSIKSFLQYKDYYY